MQKEKWIDQHIGETRLNNAGLKMTIIDGNRYDLKIEFNDKSIVEHKTYYAFIRGSIAHPRGNWIMQHLGETRKNNRNITMTITGGRAEDLQITFEDGTVVKHKTYTEFKNGSIAHPHAWIKEHYGETNQNASGLKMYITDGYATDLEITFEDGTIVKHKTYRRFKEGCIRHPNGNWIMKHMGETTVNNAGLKMTIIGTENKEKPARNITIQFEDGTIVKHKTYQTFKNGEIQHPNGNWIIKHMDETIVNNAGLKMTITGGKSTDLQITFEDGSIVNHARYDDFLRKTKAHPLYPHLTKSNHKIGCITRKNVAYKTDTCHYYCTCSICQHDDIWDWKEIHEHNALHGIPKENLIFIEPDEIKDEKQPNTNKNPQS